MHNRVALSIKASFWAHFFQTMQRLVVKRNSLLTFIAVGFFCLLYSGAAKSSIQPYIGYISGGYDFRGGTLWAPPTPEIWFPTKEEACNASMTPLGNYYNYIRNTSGSITSGVVTGARVRADREACLLAVHIIVPTSTQAVVADPNLTR